MLNQCQRAGASRLGKTLACSVSAFALPFGLALSSNAGAQETVLASNEDIVVTGSRRASTVQDTPLNIAAVSAADIENLGLADLREASRAVPGIYVIDQGARGSSRIIVRGLNADGLAAAEGINNDGGGTVATYVGEIPLYVDLKLNDMERVEFLFGPQGTLYGAGTLGGAIRYIPKKPNFSETTASLRSDVYGYRSGEGVSGKLGITINQPISDTFAIRGSVDRSDDKGFIDYVYAVAEPGVSNPDPDFTDSADRQANLAPVKDANTEQTWSGRVAARWNPSSLFDATLTYYAQSQDVGARQMSSIRSILPTGEYESNLRVVEPSKSDNTLVSLEITSDLGFADLTTAGGFSRYRERGSRDQTDLLISLEYGYEAFPSFTAFTREDQEDTTTTFEARLVSKHEGPLQYILGGFYNRLNGESSSKEFTPGFPDYLGITRPDNLEYFSSSFTDLIEKAVYGELSYDLTSAWQVTLGARYYEYNLKTNDAVDFPLLYTLLGDYDEDDIVLAYEEGGQQDDGLLYKFNTSYKFSDDKLAYFTFSEGYRIGNSNGVGPCPTPLPATQISCGLPNELLYGPDKTQNFEIGAHTQWFDKRLTLNGAVYFIKWEDPQVAAATENGLIPITKNANGAESQGVELNFDAQMTEKFSVSGSFAYNNAELTKLTSNLVPRFNPPGFQSTISYENGEPGDRLPGSPETTASLLFTYETPITDGIGLTLNYGVAAVSDVETRMGGKGGGFTVPSYELHNISARLSGGDWSITGYVDNLLDDFIETGARGTTLSNQTVTDDNGDTVFARTFFTYVLPPRVVGIRFTKEFGG